MPGALRITSTLLRLRPPFPAVCARLGLAPLFLWLGLRGLDLPLLLRALGLLLRLGGSVVLRAPRLRYRLRLRRRLLAAIIP